MLFSFWREIFIYCIYASVTHRAQTLTITNVIKSSVANQSDTLKVIMIATFFCPFSSDRFAYEFVMHIFILLSKIHWFFENCQDRAWWRQLACAKHNKHRPHTYWFIAFWLNASRHVITTIRMATKTKLTTISIRTCRLLQNKKQFNIWTTNSKWAISGPEKRRKI